MNNMNSRRGFFKTIFGATVAVVAAPLIPLATKAAPFLPDSLQSMIKRCMPSMFAAELIAVQPMDAPTGTVFHMSIGPIK